MEFLDSNPLKTLAFSTRPHVAAAASAQEGETKFNKEVKAVSSGGPSQFSTMQVSSTSSVMMKRPPLPSGSSPYVKIQPPGQFSTTGPAEFKESGNQNGGKGI